MPAGAPLVAFDLETTGISPKRDRIIEIGAVRFDATGAVLDELELLVDPGVPVPLAIQRLVGLADADLRDAPAPSEGVAQLADFCAGAQLVAHGGAFDIAFCSALLRDEFENRPLHDTLELARILLPRARSHSLPVLSVDLGLTHGRPHRALSDADATRQLFIRLMGAASGLPAVVLASMREVAALGGEALDGFFGTLVPGDGGSGAAVAGASGEPRTLTLAELPPAGGRIEERVAAFLGPDGPLARSRPEYEYRHGQVQMSRAVAQTLERRGRLLVEAGTGVGKSLAYLAPLALWAAGGGRRAVVATNTVNLQEQLVEDDLPSLAADPAEGAGPPLAYALLKGRRNYLSLRRWERFLAGLGAGGRPPQPEAVRFALKVLAWLPETRSGDRAELRLTSEEEPLWRQVESDLSDCLGRGCANWGTARCFMVGARRAADAAQLVVTNHALLLSDAGAEGRILAPYGALVVDEAHHLEASATNQLGIRLRAADVQLVLERLPVPSDPAVAGALDGCRQAVHRLFGEVKGFVGDCLGGEHPGNGLVGLSPEVRQRPGFTAVDRAARHAAGCFRTGAGILDEARGGAAFQVEPPRGPEGLADELMSSSAALVGFAAAVERVVCAPDPGEVSWLELRAEQAELRSAPVSVSEVLEEAVFGRVDAAILTSATLAVGGSFDFARSRLGIGDRAEELSLESPFDYFAQAICIVPSAMPPYDHPEYERTLARLLGDVAVRFGGRTLALFTGYGPLQRVHRLVSGHLDGDSIAVVGQGMDGTRRQILHSFRDNPRTLLLGTSALWEGVDLPGDALRCVVIAKLPFPVPTDPLVRARSQGLADPFGQYLLPTAVLRLKQGFGRLIRGGADRGAVVLCDSRLETRDYAARFFETLPPAAVERCPVDDVGRVAEGFVGRAAPGLAGARG